MARSLLSTSLLLLAAPASPLGGAEPKLPPVGMATQLAIHQRIVVRVPRIPDQPPPLKNGKPNQTPVWRERKTAKCLPMTTIAGAAFTRAESIDMILVDGRRIRARFNNDCPSLDFYQGFYLKPTADGAICVRRDAIRSRGGHACRIESFRELIRRR